MTAPVGVHFVRTGKWPELRWYIYAWRGGPRIATVESDGKPVLSREQKQAIAEARAQAADPAAHTLAGLVRDWHRSPEWKALAPNTRDTWTPALNRIEAKWADTPLELWNDARMVGKVVAWRDSMAETPRAADIGVTVLARLLEWGRLRARVRVNVAAGVPSLYRGGDRAEIIWTDEDYAAFYRSAMMLDVPQAIDIVDLDQWTGFRAADLAAVNFREVGDEALVRKALKRSRGRRRRAAIPMLQPLHELIEELRTRARKPDVETLLVNSRGEPWTADSLSHIVSRVARHAGLVHREEGEEDRNKHLHDIRGTYVTHLCRAGLTDREIADIVAWSEDSVSRIRKVYVDDAQVVVAIGRRIAAARQV